MMENRTTKRSSLTVVLALVAAVPLSGCGILLQTVMGWSSDETFQRSQTHSVQVTTSPAGAEVTRTDQNGASQVLGPAPLTDQVPYSVEETIESPKALGLVIGGALSLVGGVVMAGAADYQDPDVDDLLFSIGGGTLIYLGVQDLIIAAIYGLSGDEVKQRRVTDVSYTYKARAPNLPERTMVVKVPDQAMAALVLDGTAVQPVVKLAPPPPPPVVVAPPVVVPPPSAGPNKTWVVAVMDVDDVNKDRADQAVGKGLTENLGDQLRIFIAQQGLRTIDRSAQVKAIEEQISAMKADSYKGCYDDSCQVELGKALAASHILRSRITRFGSKCVLNAELIDLRAEVTVRAASARGDCGAEGFLDMSEEVAASVAR